MRKVLFIGLLLIASRAGAAFPTGWNSRCALTIDKTKVAADQTGFPVLIGYNSVATETNLPDEMITTGNSHAAQSDGGDIRFTSDLAGTTQLPCDISVFTQNATPANAKAEIWVKITSLSSSNNTTIYVWYNAGGGQSQPAANDTYGSQNVYDTNYKGVWHLSETGTNPTAYDESSNGNNSTSQAWTPAATKIDGGSTYNGSGQYIDVGNPSSLQLTGAAMTLSAWVYESTYVNYAGIVQKGAAGTGNYFLRNLEPEGAIYFQISGNSYYAGSTLSSGAWHYICGVYDGAKVIIYVDGTPTNGTSKTGNMSGSTDEVNFGRDTYSGTRDFNGKIDEVRISNKARSSTWITTELNNQGTPNTFWSVATPDYLGPPPSLPKVTLVRNASLRNCVIR